MNKIFIFSILNKGCTREFLYKYKIKLLRNCIEIPAYTLYFILTPQYFGLLILLTWFAQAHWCLSNNNHGSSHWRCSSRGYWPSWSSCSATRWRCSPPSFPASASCQLRAWSQHPHSFLVVVLPIVSKIPEYTFLEYSYNKGDALFNCKMRFNMSFLRKIIGLIFVQYSVYSFLPGQEK